MFIKLAGILILANGIYGLYKLGGIEFKSSGENSSGLVSVSNLFLGLYLIYRTFQNFRELVKDNKLFILFCSNLAAMALFQISAYSLAKGGVMAVIYLGGIFFFWRWRSDVLSR